MSFPFPPVFSRLWPSLCTSGCRLSELVGLGFPEAKRGGEMRAVRQRGA